MAQVSDPAERELVARCRQGDESAFRELVDRYSPMVLALAARLVDPATRGGHRAGDVPAGAPRPGLLPRRRQALHVDLPHRRRTWPSRPAAANARTTSRSTTRPGPGATYGGQDRQFTDVELRDRLDKAMARLPAHYRVLVHGHYVKGITLRGPGRVAGPAAGHGEDASVPRQAAAAPGAGGRPGMSAARLRGAARRDRAAGRRRAGHAGAARPPGRAAPAARRSWRWPCGSSACSTEWPVPAPTPAFARGWLAAARREAWRREQVVDWGFNVAIAAGLVAIVAGLAALAWLLGSAAGPARVGAGAGRRRRRRCWCGCARRRGDGDGTLLLTTTLGAWWWAEERG